MTGFASVVCLIFFAVTGVQAAVVHHPNSGETLVTGNALENLVQRVDEKSQARCMQGEQFEQVINGEKSIRKVSKMPDGYFYGMLMSFAKNACRAQKGSNGNYRSSFEGILSRPSDASVSDEDTLKKYRNYAPLIGQSPLVQNYALLMPLGMIESSGNFKDGIDKSASNTQGHTTEAGLFQVAYNSVNNSMVPPSVYESLLNEYSGGKDPQKCMTNIFNNHNVPKNMPKSYGDGKAYHFQEAMKSCPALAVDYMAVLARGTFRHNGPLKRGYAKPRESCVQILSGVENHLRNQPELCAGVEALKDSDYDFSSDLMARSQRVAQAKDENNQNILGNYLDRGSVTFDPDTGEVKWADPTGKPSENIDLLKGLSEEEKEEEIHKVNNEIYDELSQQKKELEEKSSTDLSPEEKANTRAQIEKLNRALDNESLKASKEIQESREKLKGLEAQKASQKNSPTEVESEIENTKNRIEDLIRENRNKKKSKKTTASRPGGPSGRNKLLRVE